MNNDSSSASGRERLDQVLSNYIDEAESVQLDSPELRTLRERYLGDHADLASELKDHFENEDALGAKLHGRRQLPDLGRYSEITYIGRGAMGLVYQAKDQKLGRQVALKLLPEEFTQDSDRVSRFKREAKLLASLNHPNIGAIYDQEQSKGTQFLVLEFVEGNTLADRLRHGAIPVEESLQLALQIAEALEAAHEQGVVHRDLKPANIKVRPDGNVKVLDFGLAKTFAGDGVDSGLSDADTTSSSLATEPGAILGTAAYMSPEQARGRRVDKRTDVWAFGCVLYEMLTGRSAFPESDVTDVLAAVLREEPDWSVLPANLHPRLGELLERCLRKDAQNRWQDIGDVRVDIQTVLADPNGVFALPFARGEPRMELRRLLPWVVGFGLTSVMIGLAVWQLWPTPLLPVTRFAVDLVRPLTTRDTIALSSNGRELVYPANGQLYRRRMNELVSTPIPGTEQALFPFFSPNSQSVGFFTPTQLKTVALAGGVPRVVADVVQGMAGTWGEDDNIFFGRIGPSDLFQVAATGGEIETFAELADHSDLEYPEVLPGGKWMLFTDLVTGTNWDEARLVAQSLETGERKLVLERGRVPRYASSGHLVYYRDGGLFAVEFDADRVEVIGSPVPVIENVFMFDDFPQFAFGDDGTLVFVPVVEEVELVLADRSGRLETLSGPGRYRYPRFSPDGTRLAVQLDEDNGANIFVYDIPRRRFTQLTFESSEVPLWTPDGTQVTVLRGDSLWNIPSERRGEPELVSTASEEFGIAGPYSWSPDGCVLFWNGSGGVTELSVCSDGGIQHNALLTELYSERDAAFSPDGKRFAYSTNETGEFEVYVQDYPISSSSKWKITEGGANFPVWARYGNELFFLNDGQLWAVETISEPTFDWETPVPLFPVRWVLNAGPFVNYDVRPDGQQFVALLPAGNRSTEGRTQKVNVILNWFEELKASVWVR